MSNKIDYQAGEKLVRQIDLASICVSHNPRRPIPALQDNFEEEGLAGLTPIQFLQQYALGNVNLQSKFVALVDKYESGTKGLVELANSRHNAGELEPIILRSFRVKVPQTGEYVERYGIVAGERRTLAAAYLFAKGLGNGKIGAQVRKLTVDEAYDLAIAENYHRSDPSELETGKVIRNYRERINPATGKNYSLREVATKLQMDYQYARGREALTYLDEADQHRLNSGRIGLTAAIVKGLINKTGKEAAAIADKKANRQRVMTLAEVQELFDRNRLAPGPWLEALSVVMHLSLDEAEKLSNERIAEREIREANKADQKFKG